MSTIMKVGNLKYIIDNNFKNDLENLINKHKMLPFLEDFALLELCNTLERCITLKLRYKHDKLSHIVDCINKQATLKSNLLEQLYLMLSDHEELLVKSLFSVEKSQTTSIIEIPKLLMSLNDIVQYGRTDVVGRGEITLALILKNNVTVEPGGKYDIKIDDEYWHVKDATKTGINAATISTMGKRLLWDTDVWPLNMLKKIGIDVMKLSTETVRTAVFDIANQYVKLYGNGLLNDGGNVLIAQMFQDDLDKMFRESKVWGDAVGLVILENDKFHFVYKNETYFGTMSGTGEPEFSLRKDRYKNVMIQELDINWPHEHNDIEFNYEFELNAA